MSSENTVTVEARNLTDLFFVLNKIMDAEGYPKDSSKRQTILQVAKLGHDLGKNGYVEIET
jgi:hypothetical protein